MKKELPANQPFIASSDKEAVSKVLDTRWLTCGPKVAELENNFSKLHGSYGSVAIANATLAFQAIGELLKIKENEAIIVPSICFVSDATQFLKMGATPIFMDVDPASGISNPEHLVEAINYAKKLQLKVRAVIALHLGGRICDLKKMYSIAKAENIELIEDACHAINAKNSPCHVGSCKYSRFSVFSLHAVKNITAGEGGIISCKNPKDVKDLKLMRHHSIEKNPSKPWLYRVNNYGSNFRISDIASALAISQLKRVEKISQERSRLADNYLKLIYNECRNLPIQPTKQGLETTKGHYHLFQIITLVKFRDPLIKYLRSKNIIATLHYPALHKQPVFKNNLQKYNLTGASKFEKTAISLPFYNGLTLKDQTFVIETIKLFFKQRK